MLPRGVNVIYLSAVVIAHLDRRHDVTIQWVKQRANTSEGRVKPKVSVDERTVCIHILKKPQKHYERNEVQLKSWSDQLVLIIKQEKDELEIMGNFMVW